MPLLVFLPARRFVAAHLPRLVAGLLVLAVAVSFAPERAAAGQAPTEPEAHLLALINRERVAVGRVPLQWDSRLADIAQWRSDDMVANNYFGHLPNWDPITKRMADKGIVWYYLGETLVKGTPRTPLESAEEAMRVWRASQGHWNLLSHLDYNYVAIGMAQASDGWYYWTAILLKGPDRTPPTASVAGAEMAAPAGSRRRVTVSWTGEEVPLSVMTAGLRDFRVQRRIGSRSWVNVTDWTTTTTKSFDLNVGPTYKFRVRARDRNGNLSRWSAPLVVTP